MQTLVVDQIAATHLTPSGRIDRGQYLLATRYRCHHLLGTFWEDPYGATMRLTPKGTLRSATAPQRMHLVQALRHRGPSVHCPGCARCDH